MLIKPSMIPLVMDHYDPAPGIYRAKLVDVDLYTTSRNQPGVRLKWQLLNHPDKTGIYYAYSRYGLTNTGLLSRFTYHWKAMLWAEVVALQGADGPQALTRFIGDEADVLVAHHVNANGENRSYVSDVAPAGEYVVEVEPGIYRVSKEQDD